MAGEERPEPSARDLLRFLALVVTAMWLVFMGLYLIGVRFAVS